MYNYKLINKPHDILNYILDIEVNSLESKRLVAKIEHSKKTACITHGKLQTLSLLRLKSSNTLRASNRDQEHWTEANRHLAFKINSKEQVSFNEIIKLNALLSGKSNASLRSAEIYTADMQYLPFTYINEAQSLFINQINQPTSSLTKAFYIYLNLVTIHFFKNANGRTARLAADWQLLESGYLPLYFTSPASSHVAAIINGPRRCKKECFIVFLKAILNSYKVISS